MFDEPNFYYEKLFDPRRDSFWEAVFVIPLWIIFIKMVI